MIDITIILWNILKYHLKQEFILTIKVHKLNYESNKYLKYFVDISIFVQKNETYFWPLLLNFQCEQETLEPLTQLGLKYCVDNFACKINIPLYWSLFLANQDQYKTDVVTFLTVLQNNICVFPLNYSDPLIS